MNITKKEKKLLLKGLNQLCFHDFSNSKERNDATKLIKKLLESE